MEHRSCLRGNHLHDCRNPAWESTVLRKKWNIPLIAAVFVIYILTSCLDPGINMSIREYGIYGAFSVPFFIIVGLTGSLLCIWFGKLIEIRHRADSSPTSEKYDLPARLPHLCLRSCRTYCIQIYRNSCAGRRSCTICSVSCTAHYRRRPGMPCVFRNTEPVKETPASKDQVESDRVEIPTGKTR